MTLVQELRRRRFLGRSQTVYGTVPSKPDIVYFFTMPLWLQAIAAVGICWVAYYVTALIGFAVREAFDIAVVLGLLLTIPAFRHAMMSLVRGEPFPGRAMVEDSHPAAVFAMGSLPVAATLFAPISDAPVVLAAAAVAGGFAIKPLALMADGRRLPKNLFTLPVAVEAEPIDVSHPGPPMWWVGEATGKLCELSSKTGIVHGAQVTLDLRDATKGISVLGGSGSGKTLRLISPLVLQSADLGCGGLIVDIKGDYKDTVMRIARITGRTIRTIGIDAEGINLIAGLSPDTASAFLEACFVKQGQAGGDNAVWTHLAVERSQKALSILAHVPGEYTLRSLYRFFFDPEFREACIAKAKVLVAFPDACADPIAAEQLVNALDYQQNVVANTEHRQQSSINLTLETVLSKFIDPILSRAFAASDGADLSTILDGDLFLVHVPEETYASASRTIYLMIKQRFQTLCRTRTKMAPGFRRDNPIVFIADEFHKIVSSGDAEFHDTCRSLNVVSIIASQSIEAYESAIGDEVRTRALLANFAQTFAFRSTQATMNYVGGLCGEVDFWKLSENAGLNTHPTWFGLSSSTNGKSVGRSLSEEQRSLITANLFRSLPPEQFVAVLSIGGFAMDDVLSAPLFTYEALGALS
jgi:hypothetical protein